MKFGQIGSALCIVSLLAVYAAKERPLEPLPIHPNLHGSLATLIVGGGPDKEYNQAGIESNVRYVEQLLPTTTARRVLFADGDRTSKSVFCEGTLHNYYREPSLHRIDGPSTNAAVSAELASMGKTLSNRPGQPALLYFTGHGGGDTEGDYADNYYCTWNDDQLPVSELAKEIERLPKSSPLVLVMVECYSGGFGNLIFRDGAPDSGLLDRPICGFFASADYRMSAGCTAEINEANYRDFTGYFFAALSGVDRMGKPITGADYDHDGKVTMDEAFAYTLIHDDSIDTPVCTSDVFLRRFVKTADPDCFKLRYSQVLSWARPAQRAALGALLGDLNFSDSGDMQQAYREFRRSNADSFESRVVHLTRFCRLYKTVVLTHQLLQSSDERVKLRFHALIQEEHSNPLTDVPNVFVAQR
jgi:hypothetical protein